MSKSDSVALPLTLTSKQPLRGFSSLTTTFAAGKPALTRASSFVALVLKAPQDLHASILTMVDPPPAFLGAAFAATDFFWMVFFGAIACKDLGGLPARHGTREVKLTMLSGVRGAHARAMRSCRAGRAAGARSARRSPMLSVARGSDLAARAHRACNSSYVRNASPSSLSLCREH